MTICQWFFNFASQAEGLSGLRGLAFFRAYLEWLMSSAGCVLP